MASASLHGRLVSLARRRTREAEEVEAIEEVEEDVDLTTQTVEKGPDARRRPKAAGEAYSCTLSPQPRAPQHAFSQTKQMGPYRRPTRTPRSHGGLGPGPARGGRGPPRSGASAPACWSAPPARDPG